MGLLYSNFIPFPFLAYPVTRRKSVACKGLRRAGRGLLVLNPYQTTLYVIFRITRRKSFPLKHLRPLCRYGRVGRGGMVG